MRAAAAAGCCRVVVSVVEAAALACSACCSAQSLQSRVQVHDNLEPLGRSGRQQQPQEGRPGTAMQSSARQIAAPCMRPSSAHGECKVGHGSTESTASTRDKVPERRAGPLGQRTFAPPQVSSPCSQTPPLWR